MILQIWKDISWSLHDLRDIYFSEHEFLHVKNQLVETFTFCDCFLMAVVFQLLSHAWLFVTHELQHAKLPCPSLSSGVWSNSYPWSKWCYLTISSSSPSSFFAFNLSQHQCLFLWVGSWHQVTQVSVLQLQRQSF